MAIVCLKLLFLFVNGFLCLLLLETDCMGVLNKHKREAVKQESYVINAIDYMSKNEKIPSAILPGLYLSGVKGAINLDFQIKSNIKLIVCCAKNLDDFWPVLKKKRVMTREAGIHTRLVELVDAPDQVLDESLVRDVVSEIQKCLENSGAVLVHCAQGKSRSATIVMAYLALAKGFTDYNKALEFIREKRPMAEPNEGFKKQLKELFFQNE
eukprot:m.31924 g.31924  ORF g.31924 m.31924 type:complete len:211 (+) comp9741_c1_seq3:203-835(+)